jgi:hypothetical protein
MNLPLVLDVVISLAFIYLALSLLASEMQELIATLLQWRAKHLRDSIENLIAGGGSTAEQQKVMALVQAIYEDPLIKGINQEAKGILARGFRQITRVFSGNRAGAFGQNQSTGPSYIPAATFATAFTEQLGLTSLVNRLLESRLEKFMQHIIGDVEVYVESVQLVDPAVPAGIWEIANRYGIDLTTDTYFRTLVEEFQTILADYTAEKATLMTSIERMSEALDHYLEMPAVSNEHIYFLDRVRAFKLGLFGRNNERVFLAGGLQPSLQELAAIIDRGSSVYKEAVARYQMMQAEAEKILEMVDTRARELYEAAQRNRPSRGGFPDEQAYIDSALSELSPTQYRIYKDYQAYRQAERVLDHLPVSVRESMAVLARRSQSRVRQSGNVVNEFRDSVNEFRQEVAEWFDTSMSRASGVYKRNAKGIAIIIGCLIAAFTNADTFHILNRISSDESLRQVVVSQASQVGAGARNQLNQTGDGLSREQLAEELELVKNKTDQVLSDLPLPVTWNPSNLSRQLGCPYDPTSPQMASDLPYALLTLEQWRILYKACLNLAADANVNQPVWMQVLRMINVKPFAFFRMLSGWLISGVAIAMGAPFWFDLLSKLMNVRNSGSKPPSPTENSTTSV